VFQKSYSENSRKFGLEDCIIDNLKVTFIKGKIIILKIIGVQLKIVEMQ